MPKVSRKKTTTRPDPLKNTKSNVPPKATKTSKSTAKGTTSSESVQKSPQENGANYILYARLNHTYDPMITRIFSVPSSLNFDQLHEVMQILFGWGSCHMYSFRVEQVKPKDPKQEKQVFYPNPPLMNIDFSPSLIEGIHDDVPARKSDEITLIDVFENKEWSDKNVNLIYEYDMGDSWEHSIVLLGRESASTRAVMRVPEDFPIVCLGGEGHPSAEDCGGPPAWEDLKKLFVKPRSRDPEDLRGWYRKQCVNGDPSGLDPYKWSIFDVNEELHGLAKNPDFW